MTPVNTSRRKQRLAGLPSLIALLAGVAVLFALLERDRDKTVEWYRQQADQSFDAADYKTAMVCYARVSQALPADAAAAFSLFQSMEAAGQSDAAQSLLARLAPTDRPGYTPAEMLIARRLLASNALSTQSAEAAIAHLLQARAAGSDPTLTALLSEAYAGAGQWDAAARCAQDSGSMKFEVYDRIATIAAKKDETTRAAHWRQLSLR